MAKKKGLKVIVAGPHKDFDDYEAVKTAIEESGFEIAEIVSGKATGVDTFGEQWAAENSIPIKEFPAKWNDINVEGAIIDVNQWGKKYNKAAGTMRNTDMANYADALVAVKKGDTPGTADMIRKMRDKKAPIHIHEIEPDYEYNF